MVNPYFLSDHRPRRKVDLDLWNSILLNTGYTTPKQIKEAETMYRMYGGRFAKDENPRYKYYR